MIDIVTLDQAKDQLRINDDNSDTQIQAMCDAASDIIASYLSWPTPWPYDGTDTPFPPRIQTAALLIIASLFEDREGANDPIGPAVASLLERDRDPALA